MKIKNAQKVKLKYIYLKPPLTKIIKGILKLLYIEGFIQGWNTIYNEEQNEIIIRVILKYDTYGNSLFKIIKFISKPSKQMFISIKSLWQINNNLGIFVLSTKKGIISERDARLLNCGGKVLFYLK